MDYFGYYMGDGAWSTRLPNTEVAFVLHRDGSASGVRITTTDGLPQIDSAAVRAVRAADSARAFAPFPEELLDTTIAVDVRIGLGRRKRGVALPLFPVALPWVKPTRPVVPRPRQPAPVYPRAAIQGLVESDVLVQFIVDESGRVAPGTVHVERAEYREFVQAVLDVLPQYRFTPAELNGCPVKSLVQLPFEFRMRR
ncbi:MAG: energy transducer TonB [Gemmatimonadaceae bacterium]